ncbi:MAG: LUD domain-containing protein [Bacteroidales bacterium]|nr:LUD domain-containing protein [Bacteroidales bacterium]
MSSKDYILNKIKKNTKVVFEKPSLKDISVTEFEDPIAQFKESLTAVGGEYYEVNEGEDFKIEEVINRFFPEAKTIASTLREVTSADLNPDNVDKPQDLDGIDVAVLKSDLGVAENAAIWFEQNMKHRILYFIPEALVVILDKKQIVHTMHHAYAKIDKEEIPDFGVFISGPSKTADIEQALVMGAHGARRVLVILK